MQPATWTLVTWKWLGFERRDTCQGHTTCGHTWVRMSGGITMRMDIKLWLGIVTFRVYLDLEGWLLLSVACSWHFLLPRFYGLYQSCIRVYYHCLDGWIHMIWSIHHIQKSTYSTFLDTIWSCIMMSILFLLHFSRESCARPRKQLRSPRTTAAAAELDPKLWRAIENPPWWWAENMVAGLWWLYEERRINVYTE